MKDATVFSFSQNAVSISAAFHAQPIEHGFRASLERPGIVVSILEMNGDAPHDGEMHPDGDEVIYVLEGRFSVRLGIDAPTHVEVRAGEAIIIPEGLWHKIHVLAPCRLVTMTPGPRFDFRPPAS